MANPQYPVKDYSGFFKYKLANKVFGELLLIANTWFKSKATPPCSYTVGYFDRLTCYNDIYLARSINDNSYSFTKSVKNMNDTHVGGSNCFNDFSTSSSYTSVELNSKKFVMCLTLKKVSDYLNNNPYFTFFYECSNSTETGTTGVSGNPFYGDAISTENVLATYGNYYMVTDIRFYTETTAGVVNAFNPRTLSSFYDIVLRFNAKGAYSVSSTESKYEVDTDILFGLKRSFLLSIITQPAGNGIGLHYKFLNGINGCHCLYPDISAKTKGTPLSGNNGNMIMFTMTTLKAILNGIGIPWTFNTSMAMYNSETLFNDGYVPAGQPNNEIGGGDGNGDNADDETPTYEPAITGVGAFNKNYAICAEELNNLSTFLWNATFLDNFRLLFNNPAETVIGIRMYPFSLTAHDATHVGALEAIRLGNVNAETAFGRPITGGYNAVFDMGTYLLPEYFGSALDYEPYTTISIYLPYIGIKDIETNDVVGKTLQVKYVIDITTGGTVINIYSNNQLRYTYSGKIGIDLPISSTNASEQTAGLMFGIAGGAVGLTASALTGNALGAVGSVLATAKSVASAQRHVAKGGYNTPNAGLYMPQMVYLIINRPVQSLASTFGKTHGFPCNVSKTLSELNDYTEVENPILDNIPATDEEKAEIKTLLETGVYIE